MPETLQADERSPFWARLKRLPGLPLRWVEDLVAYHQLDMLWKQLGYEVHIVRNELYVPLANESYTMPPEGVYLRDTYSLRKKLPGLKDEYRVCQIRNALTGNVVETMPIMRAEGGVEMFAVGFTYMYPFDRQIKWLKRLDTAIKETDYDRYHSGGWRAC